jgi:hypothetical protein
MCELPSNALPVVLDISCVVFMNDSRKAKRRLVRPADGGDFECPPATVLLPSDSAGRRFSVETTRPSTKHVQAFFLNAVAFVAPAVLSTLREEPLSALRESTWSLGNVFLTPLIVETDPRLRQLRVALNEWSTKWHLQNDWCREWTCATLGWWRVNPGSTAGWFNPKPTSDLAPPPPPPPAFDPTVPRSDYERRHRAYLESVEQFAVDHLLKTPEFRQPAHFYWLTGHHVLGWTQSIIAEAACVQPFAVQYAIKTLRRRLGLTPRPDLPKALRGLEHKRQKDEIARLLNQVS